MWDAAKEAAARRALDFVKDGMIVGLGTGSTAEIFTALLCERIKEGLRLEGCVPSSRRAMEFAERAGAPLLALDDWERVDLAVDGADEMDPSLNMIKGQGGAFLWEKILASRAARLVIIVDESKMVEALGAGASLPIEAARFGARAAPHEIARAYEGLSSEPPRIALRLDEKGGVFKTDGGNCVYDCEAGIISEPATLAARLDHIPVILGHGLFIGLAQTALIGDKNGRARAISRKELEKETL